MNKDINESNMNKLDADVKEEFSKLKSSVLNFTNLNAEESSANNIEKVLSGITNIMKDYPAICNYEACGEQVCLKVNSLFTHLGNNYFKAGLYEKSLSMFNQALEYRVNKNIGTFNREMGSFILNHQTYDVCWGISLVYEKLKKYSLAIERLMFMLSALEKELKDVEGHDMSKNEEVNKIVNSVINCADLFIASNNEDEIEKMLINLSGMMRECPYLFKYEMYGKYMSVKIHSMLMGLGYRYISEGKYNEALKIFNKVLKEALTEPFVVAVNEEKKELNCDSQVFDVYWNIAVTYEKLKLNNLAIKELVLGIKLLEDSLDDVNALRTYKNIEAEKFIRKIYELKITKYDVDGLNEVCRLMKSTKLLAGYVPYFTNEIKGLEEFLEKKRILESMPRSMLISLTGKCNLRCIMCGDPKIPWEVSEHTVNEIIDMMPYLRDIQWRGGEAFFCGNFKKLFESAARYPHLKQSINTNGTLLTKEWIERIVETNTTIVFSIDGITKESYEHIRRGANYKQVLGNLEALAKYRDKYKSAVTGGFCGTNIEMTFVIMKSNYKDLEHIVEFVKKYKIDVLRLSKMICSPSFEENINPEIYEYVANKISRIKSELKQINVDFRDWSIDKPRDVPELGSITKAIRPALPAAAQESGIRKEDINADNAQESFCRAPYSLLFINTGGDVYPHCFCGAPIGNVDTGSLKDMWNNSLMQMYRAGFKHDNSPKVCKPQELSRCWELMG